MDAMSHPAKTIAMALVSGLTILVSPARPLQAAAAPPCLTRPANAGQARAAAGHWFKQGAQLFGQQRYLAAKAAFLCSLQMKPHPVTIYNIARSATGAGQVKEALRYYQRYLQLRPRAPDTGIVQSRIHLLEALAKRLDTATRASQMAQARLQTLEQKLRTATAFCDQRLRSLTTLATRNCNKAASEAQGHCEQTLADAQVKCDAKVKQLATTQAPDATQWRAVNRKLQRTWRAGLAFVIMGAALALGGGIAGIVALTNRASLRDLTTWTSKNQDTYDSYRHAQSAFWGLTGAGAGSALIGGVLMGIGTRRTSERSTAAAPSPGARITVGLSPTPGGGFVQIQGAF